MNVTCPNCAAVYRVDPAKVPEAGVRARCAICSAIFPVRRDMPEPEVVTAAVAAAGAITSSSSAPVPPPAAPVAERERTLSPPVAQAPPAAPIAPGAPPSVAAPRPAGLARPAATVPAPPPAPPPSPSPAAPTARPINPFLSQDPSLKARRLARALISDMVVYHPAKRQEGIREGTLKDLFADEIKKSWEEYTDQVGREIAESTPYFREALNEILAGGKQLF